MIYVAAPGPQAGDDEHRSTGPLMRHDLRRRQRQYFSVYAGYHQTTKFQETRTTDSLMVNTDNIRRTEGTNTAQQYDGDGQVSDFVHHTPRRHRDLVDTLTGVLRLP